MSVYQEPESNPRNYRLADQLRAGSESNYITHLEIIFMMRMMQVENFNNLNLFAVNFQQKDRELESVNFLSIISLHLHTY